ncbi:MAG: cell division protein FtsQ/DivIB [Solirubrobacterales bacterium]
MRRWLAALVVVLLAVAALYWFVLRDKTVAAEVHVPELTATIGSGEDAVGVAADGRIVPFLEVPDEPPLPRLPLDKVPESGRLAGPVLAQARVLGAAPEALRPYVERSYLGESGIDVILTTGIELRFGEASQAKEKWRAAAAVLANPEITALDYVDLRAPGHPAVGGSEHSLPPAP